MTMRASGHDFANRMNRSDVGDTQRFAQCDGVFARFFIGAIQPYRPPQ
jgi:hypothetical protein